MRFDCLRKGHSFTRSEKSARRRNAIAKHGFMAEVARRHGYAIGIHGSLIRDIDLVAIPWTPAAIDPEALALRIAGSMQLVVIGEPMVKPHGRLAVAMFSPSEPTQQIDLSIVPPDRNHGRSFIVVDRCQDCRRPVGEPHLCWCPVRDDEEGQVTSEDIHGQA